MSMDIETDCKDKCIGQEECSYCRRYRKDCEGNEEQWDREDAKEKLEATK